MRFSACSWCELVWRTLREGWSRKPSTGLETKLKAVRKAAGFSFPTADMEQMLHEIERGYEA
jgi:hypothetical protein